MSGGLAKLMGGKDSSQVCILLMPQILFQETYMFTRKLCAPEFLIWSKGLCIVFCPPVAQHRGKQSHYSHLSIEQEVSYWDRKYCILFRSVECNLRYLKSHVRLHFMCDIVINPIWLYCLFSFSNQSHGTRHLSCPTRNNLRPNISAKSQPRMTTSWSERTAAEEWKL